MGFDLERYYKELKEKSRVIVLPLTGKENEEIISTVIGQMSDGIWEESSYMRGYWEFVDSYLNPETNNVELIVDKSWFKNTWGFVRNKFCCMSDNDIIDFFANKIKKIVSVEKKDELTFYNNSRNKDFSWRKDNDLILAYFHGDTKISDCYKVYNLLKNN